MKIRCYHNTGKKRFGVERIDYKGASLHCFWLGPLFLEIFTDRGYTW